MPIICFSQPFDNGYHERGCDGELQVQHWAALMALTMRPTGLSSGVNEDQQDWTVLDEGREVGRLYGMARPAHPRSCGWFWSELTSGKAPTLSVAKAQFEAAWRQWLAWAKLAETP